MAREIVIRIEIPDGVATPLVDYNDVPVAVTGTGQPVYSDTRAPDSPADQAAQIFPAAEVMSNKPECAEHGAMRYYPAGHNDKTGKDFSASYRCPVPRCNTRPVWGV